MCLLPDVKYISLAELSPLDYSSLPERHGVGNVCECASADQSTHARHSQTILLREKLLVLTVHVAPTDLNHVAVREGGPPTSLGVVWCGTPLYSRDVRPCLSSHNPVDGRECDVVVGSYCPTSFTGVITSDYGENVVICKFGVAGVFAPATILAATFGGIVDIVLVCAWVYVVRVYARGLVTRMTCEQPVGHCGPVV